ncbi:MAG: hypothetical protein WAL98_09230 [Desulfatiglandaceae bacterium]|jgi:hypothetical protein
MKARVKIIVTIGVAVLVFAVLSVSALLYYYYTHPAKVKSLVEKFVSSSIGASLSIQRMTYSHKPLKLELEGVHVGPGKTAKGFSLDVPSVTTDFSFEGSWGHRTLVVRNILVPGFTSHISENPELPGVRKKPAKPSFLGGLLRRLFVFFVFRDLRLQSAEIHNGLVSARLGERTLRADHIRATLEAGQPVELFCEIRAAWPSQGMKLFLPLVHLTADRKLSFDDPAFNGFLSLKGALFESPMAGIRDLEARASLLYQVREKKLSFRNAEVVSGWMNYKKGVQEKISLPGVRITTGGEVYFGNKTLRADPLHVTLGDGLQFEGLLNAGFGTQPEIGVKILKSSFFPERLRSLLPREIKVPPVTLTGPLNLTGNIKGLCNGNGENAWIWKGDLHAGFRQNHLSFVSSSVRGSGMIAGKVSAKGTFPDIRVSGAVNASDILLSGIGLDLKPLRVSFSFSGSYPKYDIMNLSALISSAGLVYKGRELLIRDMKLKAADGKADAVKRTLSLPAIHMDSSLLKNLEASLNVDRSEIAVKLKGRETGFFDLAHALELLPSGWKASGLDHIEAEARLRKEEGYVFSTRVTLGQFSFQNREATSLGEALAVKADIGGKIDPSFSRIEAHVAVRADRGEVLYDRFYFDLKKNPFSFSAEGMYNVRKGGYRLAGLTLGLKSILQLHMNGELHGSGAARGFDVSMNIPGTPLGPVFETLLKDPFQTEKPILSAMDAAGSVSGDFRVRGTGSQWAAKGRLLWKGGALSIGSDRGSLEGIDLSLPLWYRNYNKKDSLKPLRGRLSVRSMKTPFIAVQPLNLDILAGPNTLSIPAPTLLRVPGGTVRIGPLKTMGWGNMKPSCETSLSVDSFRLGPLLAKLSTQSIRGVLNGSLDSIHIEKGIMSSRGKMEARVFGGSVLFSNIGASGLFTSTPVFKLDARWHDLDLAKLTAGTGFGKIQGVLKGHVNRLEIAGGQPQRFELLLETVRKKGVPQRISVKAVDHIAELGGGQSPFVGAAGVFAGFFKEFPYQKIGVHASLENDAFRINGTIRDGDKEYLVKRSLFSGVNVINQNPDSRVSFKDMVKRLRRVTQSKSGPVVR